MRSLFKFLSKNLSKPSNFFNSCDKNDYRVIKDHAIRESILTFSNLKKVNLSNIYYLYIWQNPVISLEGIWELKNLQTLQINNFIVLAEMSYNSKKKLIFVQGLGVFLLPSEGGTAELVLANIKTGDCETYHKIEEFCSKYSIMFTPIETSSSFKYCRYKVVIQLKSNIVPFKNARQKSQDEARQPISKAA